VVAYKALYREWRPKSFQEVIGQDHVSVTLQNAVVSGRVAHAYLFCGPRGTGKTSSAKVLAKALNCESGPTSEPCNCCELCMGITNGTSLDVIEIDAASNRGIDEIRDLREKVKFAPSEGRYKVYIIDEVHMLTTEAFNALLKTLEEPPSQVVFILATTEPHKIPATILSRVQRFDFKRISIADIVGRLNDVAAELGGEVDGDALLLIARKAEGGMRDALSLLDQCYKMGERLDVNRVVSVLGSLSEEEIFSLAGKLLEGDSLGVLSLFDQLLIEGKDLSQILRELTEHLRNLLVLKTAGKAEGLVYASAEFLPKLIDQSAKVSIHKLIHLITLFVKTDGELRYSTQPRITLEVALISGSSAEPGDQALPGREPGKIEAVRSHKPSPAPVAPRPEAKVREVPKVETAGESRKDSVGLSMDRVQAEWKKVLDQVKRVKIGTYAFLVEGQPISLNGDLLTLRFKERNAFHRDKVDQPDNKKVVEQAIFSVLGYPLGIKCIIGGEAVNQAESEEDLISKTYEIFGQDLVEVKE